jgi:CSLREA domain-containing protein
MYGPRVIRFLPALVIAAVVAFPVPAQAGTLTVTKTADTNDSSCDLDCSLREAIIAANAVQGPDTILVPAGIYKLSITGQGEDAGATGDLDIKSTVTIKGVGGTAIVRAEGIDRVMQVFPLGRVVLSRLWLTGGSLPGNEPGGGIASTGRLSLVNSIVSGNRTSFAGTGGGIDNSGNWTLTLIDSVVNGNAAGNGGGIHSSGQGSMSLLRTVIAENQADNTGGIRMEAGGTASIVNSTFTANAGLGGGGFLNGGTITQLTNSVFDANSAIQGGGLLNGGTIARISGTTFTDNFGGHFGGGAIDNFGTISLIADSTFSENETQGEGGGIFNGGTITTLRNSTFSGNRAWEGGGGIWNQGTLTVRGVTVTNNRADTDFGNDPNGGGLFVASGTLAIGNSIVAGNQDPDGTSHPDCSGTVSSNDYNLIGDLTGCTGFTGPHDDVGPVALKALGRYGGPTDTHALPPGSVALNHGPATGGGTDQRGVPRPQGPALDTGAYERALCSGYEVNVVGTPGNDVVAGTPFADGILALGGADTVRAGQGNDRACGGTGNDKLFGEAGNDRLLGESGDDLLNGCPGLDVCVGGSGSNKLKSC